MNKLKIQKSFDAASQTYENVAMIQKECAEILVNCLWEKWPTFSPETILDLGAGTGYVPEFLLRHFPSSMYKLNDISPSMLEQAREKFKYHQRFEYLLGDMETLDYGFHDLIVSNFALQWVEDLELKLTSLYNKSKVLAFSCLLQGTFAEWQNILHKYHLGSAFMHYPLQSKVEQLLLNLNPCDFQFYVKVFRLKFQNAKSFVTYLKTLGASTSSGDISYFYLKDMLRNHNEEFEVSYKVFFGLLKRL